MSGRNAKIRACVVAEKMAESATIAGERQAAEHRVKALRAKHSITDAELQAERERVEFEQLPRIEQLRRRQGGPEVRAGNFNFGFSSSSANPFSEMFYSTGRASGRGDAFARMAEEARRAEQATRRAAEARAQRALRQVPSPGDTVTWQRPDGGVLNFKVESVGTAGGPRFEGGRIRIVASVVVPPAATPEPEPEEEDPAFFDPDPGDPYIDVSEFLRNFGARASGPLPFHGEPLKVKCPTCGAAPGTFCGPGERELHVARFWS